MKVLFVSQCASPNPVGGNNNVYRQARALKQTQDVNVEILTWPDNSWLGLMPIDANGSGFSYFEWFHEGLDYHIIRLPKELLRRVPQNSDWDKAVRTGCELLRKIDPSIVHLQHWKGFGWIFESADRLSLPTVYTSHDWGLGCLRTILTKGDGGLCDGVVDVQKCIDCIWKGRNLIGKTNELLVWTDIGERLIKKLDHSLVERWLTRNGAIRMGLNKRVNINFNRAKSAISRLDALIVPSLFAKEFFQQFGIAENKIHVEPWYYDLPASIEFKPLDPRKIVLGYIGRISPEKGIKRIFDALSRGIFSNRFHIVIAGAIQDKYAKSLHYKFRHNIGKHSVEWMGWIPYYDIQKFYTKVDVVIIPSKAIDNTPLTLIESFAFKRPVIVTDIPSVRGIVEKGKTGYLISFDSTKSLEQVIERISLRPHELIEMKSNIPGVKTSVSYANTLKSIYSSINPNFFTE